MKAPTVTVQRAVLRVTQFNLLQEMTFAIFTVHVKNSLKSWGSHPLFKAGRSNSFKIVGHTVIL